MTSEIVNVPLRYTHDKHQVLKELKDKSNKKWEDYFWDLAMESNQ